MKALIFGLTVFFSGVAMAQNMTNDVCSWDYEESNGGDIDGTPQPSSVVAAAQSFSIDFMYMVCEMKSKIAVTEHEDIYIDAYDLERGEMRFTIYDFSNNPHGSLNGPRPIQRKCSISYSEEPAGGSSEDGSVTLLLKLVIGDPVCVEVKN
jgi:hypothetical protein